MIDQLSVLPHSVESERAVLGGLLLDPDQLDSVRSVLTPGDFYVERHAVLWDAMVALAGEGQPVDLLTLQAHLEARGGLDVVGGPAYLATLDLELPDIGRLGAYADIVRERSVRRRAIQAASEGIRSMCNGGGVGAVATLQAQLEALAGADLGRGGFRPAHEIADELLVRIEEGATQRISEGPRLGIPEIDHLYGGVGRGKLALIGARSGVGKSAMMVQMIAGDLAAGRKVAVLSLELSEEELLCRLWGHQLGINWTRVWRGGCELTRDQWRQLYRLRAELAASRQLFIDDTCAGLGLEALLARLRVLVKQEGVTVAYLDFFTMIPRAGKRAAHEERDEQAYRIASFAKTPGHEISFVLLTQCNRGPAKESRWPMVADLRDAGEQPASYVFLLHRDPVETTDGTHPPVYGETGAVILGKARQAEEGATLAHFDGRRQRWMSRAAWEAEQRVAQPDEPQPEQEGLF